MSHTNPALVIDNGSSMMKAGFSADNAPKKVFPTIIGRFNHPETENNKCLIGDEAQLNREVVNLNYPIKKCIITDFDDMTDIWHHTFSKELKISPEERSILLTYSRKGKKERERMTKIMFETFEFRNMYINEETVLSLYASGRIRGAVVNSGYEVTRVASIYDGYSLPICNLKLNFGGKQMTDYLNKNLIKKPCFNNMQLVRDMKENNCFVSQDFEADKLISETTTFHEKKYELPDGSLIKLNQDRFKSTEALFQSKLFGINDYSIQDLLLRSIRTCDIDIRHEIFNNIVMSGGTSLLKGFFKRLRKETKSNLSSNAKIRIICPPERRYSAWLGGSISSSLSTFQQLYVTKQEYEESGPSIVHRKCY